MPRVTALFVLMIIAMSAPDAHTKTSASYYADSRGFNSATLQAGTSGLPLGLRVWGFVDLLGNERGGRLDAARNFVEYRLIRSVWRAVEAHAEYNDASGENNSLLRYGIGIAPRFQVRGRPGWALARFCPYETDNSGQQITFAWSAPITSRMRLNGFVDYNIQRSGSNRWVVEPEIAITLNDQFALAIEPRYNGFEAQNPELDGFGIAFGGTVKF